MGIRLEDACNILKDIFPVCLIWKTREFQNPSSLIFRNVYNEKRLNCVTPFSLNMYPENNTFSVKR